VPSPQADAHAPATQFCVHGVQPQSAAQFVQSSHSESQVPSPQVDSHAPDVQTSVHATHPQSSGQLSQSSQAASQAPSPQVDSHTPVVQISVHDSHAQSLGQLSQSSQSESHVPSPQVVRHRPDVHTSAHASHAQSVGQSVQFSQDGSHVLSPQVDTHVSEEQVSVQGAQAQSAGQLSQPSQAASQVSSPQVDTHRPISQLSAQNSHEQSVGHVLQFSQDGLHVPSPQMAVTVTTVVSVSEQSTSVPRSVTRTPTIVVVLSVTSMQLSGAKVVSSSKNPSPSVSKSYCRLPLESVTVAQSSTWPGHSKVEGPAVSVVPVRKHSSSHPAIDKQGFGSPPHTTERGGRSMVVEDPPQGLPPPPARSPTSILQLSARLKSADALFDISTNSAVLVTSGVQVPPGQSPASVQRSQSLVPPRQCDVAEVTSSLPLELADPQPSPPPDREMLTL